CQPIVSGTNYGTRKFPRGVEPDFLCKKSLFYGHVESSFAVYDSVVLTGPGTEGLPPWRPSASPWAGISTMASPPAVEPGCWTDRVQVPCQCPTRLGARTPWWAISRLGSTL